MPKGFQVGHCHSEEVKRKIGMANTRKIHFVCEYCGKWSSSKPSAYNRKKRHFCSMGCYAEYRKHFLPTNEQHRFGTGADAETVRKKVKARCDLNHAVRDGKVSKEPCKICGSNKSEAHHQDYNKPLEVIWLCFNHHREFHKNPELLEGK